MKDLRIKKLSKFIKLKSVNNHIEIIATFRSRKLKQKTSIRSNLSKFEKQCVIIHVYKVLEQAESNSAAKDDLYYTNYAEVFGSPWKVG